MTFAWFVKKEEEEVSLGGIVNIPNEDISYLY